MWNIIGRSPSATSSNLTWYRGGAGLFLILSAMACGTDKATAPATQASAEYDASVSSTAPTEAGTCPACAFGPRLYTRATGQPVTNVATFSGNPAGAYFIEIDDHGTQGANATVLLNGEALDARSGYIKKAVSLRATNELQTRLTGKPGSKLEVSVFQEVHSVTVTPNLTYTRMPSTQQFTAVARDANGVVIPGQTFEWQSSHATIATIGVNSGLATTTGAVNDNRSWHYETITTGEGTTQIVARAIGTSVQGSVPWKISAGFVYTTFRASLPLNSAHRADRPNPVGLRYDVARLNTMAARCDFERTHEMWFEARAGGERLFFQCFPELQLTNLRRQPLPFGLYAYSDAPNVGLYGRYCGEGHPDGVFYHGPYEFGFATGNNYQPKDPIDAMCMEHDAQDINHELSKTDVVESIIATCIVRYGIETETLYEDGVRILPGSSRWHAFWDAWPRMFETSVHFLAATLATCPDGNIEVGGVTIRGVYKRFLDDRGLSKP